MRPADTAPFNIQSGGEPTGNVRPLLHEIRHALQKLLDGGEASIIDLRSIPLAPGEEETILETLGTGEVQVKLNALGPSEIQETRYSGVWLVTHFNESGSVVSRFIEITELPEILGSQREDMQRALHSLATELQAVHTEKLPETET